MAGCYSQIYARVIRDKYSRKSRIRERATIIVMGDMESRTADRKGWRKYTREQICKLPNQQQLMLNRDADR